jgi:hypothetical protein
MRFLVPITPLLAVLAAEACGLLTQALRTTFISASTHVFHVILVVLLILNLPPFTPLHEADRVKWDGWLTSVVHRLPIAVVVGAKSEKNYLIREVHSYAAWRYINTHLPANARVLTFSGGDNFYSERERIWSNSTVAHRATWGAPAGSERQAFRTLLKLGISHVLFDKRQLTSIETGTIAIAQPSVLDRWFELMYEDIRFALYRLRWDEIISRVNLVNDM